jgi:SAM-dependent methyltransferase
MVIRDQLQQIESLYTNNINELGVTSRAVGWKTDQCQELRFAKLATLIEYSAGNYTLNDYGCGFGAMLTYLMRDMHHTVTAYHGYDISPEMLVAAKRELAAFPSQLFLIRSDRIETEADYSFVSGTFNVCFDATRDAWEEFIRQKLEEMHRFSRRGFAFNLLTSYVDYEEPHLYYGDPCFWFDYCKRTFSRQVSLLHDYPLWEWTMIIKKEV